jgi:Zn-dependent peptidase ImmA (M78 family)
MSEDEIGIYYIDLPVTVPALVQYDAEGYPSIYINARLNDVQQRAAGAHELKHIEDEDVWNDKDIKEIEGEAQ